MSTYTVRFDVVRDSRTLRGKCVKCGKKCQETESVEHTVSPFNVVPGTSIPRTRVQVRDAVREELEKRIAKLQARGVKCAECR